MSRPLLPLSQLLSQPQSDRAIAWVAERTTTQRAERPLTLADLRRDVARLVTRLQGQPVRRWALCYQESYPFAVALLACGYAGCQVVLPGHNRLAQLVELADHLDGVLTDLPLEPTLDLPWPVCSTIEHDAVGGDDPCLPEWTTELSCVLFTSGSTGQPKAIAKSQRQLEAELAVQWSLWHSQWQGGRVLATVSHQHIYGLLFRVLLPLCAGVPFASQNLEFPEQLCQWVADHPGEPWLLVSSPAFLTRLDPQLAAVGCRLLYSSGGPLPHAAALQSQRLFGLLPIEIYGSSETGGIAWRQALQADTPWQPLPGLEVSQDEQGCLRLRSPFLADEDLADEKPWLTSDKIALHAEGFTLLGRLDRIVKQAEKRVSLDEVERRLRALDWVAEVVVLPLEQGARQLLGAVLVLSAEGERQWQRLGGGNFLLDLRQQLRPWLEPVALPRRVRCVTALPRNSQGKLPYLELKELFDVPLS